MDRLLSYLYGGARFAVADDGVVFDCKQEAQAMFLRHIEDTDSGILLPDHPPARPRHPQWHYWTIPGSGTERITR